ncbi:pre-mRNA processing factor 3-domain-containing protein [Mycena amicta]|nr:pre-mRNA processing factor 3-domain-containing protein [Mycena amicta]
MSDKKRAFDGNGETSATKKLKRSANGSGAAPALSSSEALIAQKRAEIAAKLAAMRNQNPALAAASSASASSGPAPASGTSVPSADAINKRIKRLVEDAHTRMTVNDNPYMSNGPAKKKPTPADTPPQGAGLKMAAHPLLLDTTPAAPQSKKDRYKPMQPKFASIKANVRNAPTPPPAPPPVPVVEKSNPYTSAATSKETLLFEGAPKERSGRNFRFNTKGKYVALGNQMRQDNQLEALKQRIAESARKAGLDGDMGIERGVKRAPPPEAEWWDQPLLPNKNYADLDEYAVEEIPNIRSVDSPITIYIQHPIPIPAPGDKNNVALKPMMLTTKERKKMRKLKRAADLQDKRDRVAMGLIPPDAPKVRLSNMMKVLTSDAVQDPTKVEARIRREVAMRKHTHEKMNEERKLTDEQRREKEDKRGIYGAVFKVKVLSDPAHQFKVRKNADQLNLSGLCILHRNFSMVYVEGPAKFLKKYKKLMMDRIAWTEAARPRGGEDVVLQDEDGDDSGTGKGKGKATEDEQEPVSLENNKCWMVWEGMLRERAFREFRVRHCPTDGAAKELLGERLRGNWREEDDFM